MDVWEESFQQGLALDVNAFAIKEQIRLAIAGIALVHMQELIRVNILFLYTKFKQHRSSMVVWVWKSRYQMLIYSSHIL